MPKLKPNTIIAGEEENAEINAGIDSDPDTYELSDNEFKQMKPVGRPPSNSKKIPISIRLSPEVVEHFKSTGKGWQTRVDETLKRYIKESS